MYTLANATGETLITGLAIDKGILLESSLESEEEGFCNDKIPYDAVFPNHNLFPEDLDTKSRIVSYGRISTTFFSSDLAV